jgi:sugar/nucleoside kinase (ribokinase family)
VTTSNASGARTTAGGPRPPRVLVLGDLVLDVVLQAGRTVESGTDVPGRVVMRQGGSAANTARWLGKLGARVQLVCAVGRDGAGRSLVHTVERDGVSVRASHVAGVRTGRIGVLVAPGGERSFVADRRAALELRPDDLRDAWFTGLDLIHLPAYSFLGEPVAQAARRAVDLARAAGALVSVDLSSVGPLLERGRRAAQSLVASLDADVLFANATEAAAFLGRSDPGGLLAYGRVVVVKMGARGARVIARAADGSELRFEVATRPVAAADTTGAGDAFSAGFIVGWLEARAAGRAAPDALHRATLAGHRAAARQLTAPRPELPAG